MIKLDIVNAIVVDYPALAQAIMNSGATDPNALIRFSNNQLQLRNATTGLVRQRLRGVFVIVQIALAVVLLVGAGLMTVRTRVLFARTALKILSRLRTIRFD